MAMQLTDPPLPCCHAALTGPQCAAVQGHWGNIDRCPDERACELRAEGWLTQGMDGPTYRGWLMARAIEAELIVPPT